MCVNHNQSHKKYEYSKDDIIGGYINIFNSRKMYRVSTLFKTNIGGK